MDNNESKIFLKKLGNNKIEAYKLMYDYYYRILVLYSMKFVQQEEIAKDIVQDVLVSIWEQDNLFETISGLKNFLYSSVRNKSLNHIKHLKVEENYLQSLGMVSHDPNQLELEIEEQEIYRRIFEVIDELPAKCKEIFEMHLNGKKNKEIAEILKLSIETVKTQKRRAMKHLRNRINPIVLMFFLA